MTSSALTEFDNEFSIFKSSSSELPSLNA
jgi:hypothetical protein